MSFNRSVALAVALAVAATAWIVSGQFGGEVPPPATAAAPAEPQPAAVRFATSHAEPYASRILVTGRTQAVRRVELRAETEGRVERIAAERGARVAAGSTIVQLAADDRGARLERARATVEQRRLEERAARTLAEKGFQAETRRAEARAQLEAAQAELAQIELDIRRTRIAAPFDGVLDSRPVELGDFLRIGDAVATVVDLDPALVVAAVSERERLLVAPGLRASARLVDGSTAEGTITYVGAVADPATRTFRVELEFPNPNGKWAEGVTAELRVGLPPVPAHHASPAVLQLDRDGRLGVKTVDATGRIAFLPATVIGGDGTGVWLAGLPETISLVTVGQDFVQPGERVTAVPADRPAPQAAEATR